VKRWKCKRCGQTCASLPNFVLPQRQYLVEVIHAGLSAHFEDETVLESRWFTLDEAVARIPFPEDAAFLSRELMFLSEKIK